MPGWSPSDPLPRAVTSRTYWDCAQMSGGAAHPAGLPFVIPMDAVAGSEPYGDAATAGSSQACSGTIPSPDVMDCMVRSSDPAAPAEPVCRSCSARSPSRIGHRCPDPLAVGNHGAPDGEQSVGSGT